MSNSTKFQQLFNEAVSHHKNGKLARADALYRQLVTLAPRHALLYDLMGQLAQQQGRNADALKYYTHACRLDDRAVGAAVRLASVLIANQQVAEAEKFLRGFTTRVPNNAEAWNALAYALKVGGKLVEAVACHERAQKADPKFVMGWYHFGLTVASLGHNFKALQYHEKALQIDPRFAPARHGRAQCLHKIYRMEEAVADYDAFLKAEPNNHEARSYRLFALQNLDRLTREELFAEHRAYGKAVGEGPAMLPGYDLSPDRRLRVAIFSPDLRTHSCAYFLEPLLRHLDPAQFELYLYHDHFVQDAVTARLKAFAAQFRNFIGQPHPPVEQAIRAGKPDILIDLTGHIGMTVRLPLFAKRLAPVQITYLGYPDTTGVPAMDFRFTDAIADPPGDADRFATEKLVRFAPTAWAYQPPADAPAVAPPPAASGAPITFGCFSSPTKFTDSLFKAWARILEAVPNSRLKLKGRDFEEAPVREHMLGRLRAQGVPIERLELLPRTAGTVEHLQQYAQIDIVLDTFPYTGTTTTCEALWMGRPVVTLGGDRHAARVGASLLTAIDHPEWIAADIDGYVRIAADLASDPARLATLGQGMREQMTHSPLLDHAGQAARFAQALRDCWRAKVAGYTG